MAPPSAKAISSMRVRFWGSARQMLISLPWMPKGTRLCLIASARDTLAMTSGGMASSAAGAARWPRPTCRHRPAGSPPLRCVTAGGRPAPAMDSKELARRFKAAGWAGAPDIQAFVAEVGVLARDEVEGLLGVLTTKGLPGDS